MSSEQGSETLGETRTGSAEQVITETRAGRDATRADPANWSRLDLNRMPDAGKYFPEPRTGAAESAGETGTREIQEPTDAVTAAGTSDRSGITVAFTADADHGLPGPGEPAWNEPVREHSAHRYGSPGDPAEYAPPGSQRPETTEPRIRDTQDVRGALLAGHSVSDVRQAVTDQVPDPKAEPTTELIGEEEQGRRYELRSEKAETDRLGERLVPEELDEATLGRRVRNVLVKEADDVADIGKKAGQIASGLADRPPGQPITVHRDQPVVRIPDGQDVQGDHVASLALLTTVAVVKGTEVAVSKFKRWMEKHEARN